MTWPATYDVQSTQVSNPDQGPWAKRTLLTSLMITIIKIVTHTVTHILTHPFSTSIWAHGSLVTPLFECSRGIDALTTSMVRIVHSFWFAQRGTQGLQVVLAIWTAWPQHGSRTAARNPKHTAYKKNGNAARPERLGHPFLRPGLALAFFRPAFATGGALPLNCSRFQKQLNAEWRNVRSFSPPWLISLKKVGQDIRNIRLQLYQLVGLYLRGKAWVCNK